VKISLEKKTHWSLGLIFSIPFLFPQKHMIFKSQEKPIFPIDLKNKNGAIHVKMVVHSR
jgi:hypothetical protein